VIERAFVSTRVLVDGALRPAAVLVADGKIVDVVAPKDRPAHVDVVDFVDDVILPGLVDSHVHVNEPGRTAWEGFATATQAAAAGGVTALVDMPLNSIPPTTSVPALREKRDAARGQCAIDVAFWGGVVPGNSGELAALVREGVRGFKCFLIDSGVSEFQNVSERDLDASLGILRDANVPLLTHAELQGPIDRAPPSSAPKNTYRFHLESRPKAAEDEAIALMVRMAKKHRARVHIVHHSSSSALSALEQARNEGVALTVETCPHYLSFAAEDIPDGATWFKCTPPIRERANQVALWEALKGGVLDAVVSDHSPCSVALKKIDLGDFDAAWGGISSLQVTLAATWTGARAHGASLADIARWMSAAPAQLAGLTQKGSIARGKDADLVAFDPDAHFRVDQNALAHKNKLSPYHARELFGVVRSTWLRGECVYRRGSDVTLRNGRLL
jgi:allantoinase